MTDAADVERAERLARLNRRRTGTDRDSVHTAQAQAVPHRRTPVFAPPIPPAAPTRTVAVDPAPSPVAQRRRRSPATTAKIVTVGASTTAVLGMMAGYGIADQAAASKPVLLPPDQAVAAAPADVTRPIDTAEPAAPPTTAPPQVIVVVIDGATGRPISGDFDLSTLATTPPGAADTQAGSITPAASPRPSTAAPAGAPTPEPTPAPPASPAPAPVAAPAAVDLAVPAPPPPPAPAVAAPAPQPQATSGGS